MSSRKDRAIELLRRLLRRKDHTQALAQFRDALSREILLTERLRIKAVIVTVSLLIAVVTFASLRCACRCSPASRTASSIWLRFIRCIVPFLLFELVVLYLLTTAAGDASGRADAAALFLGADRNQYADLRAVSAHELDGIGAGARLRGAAGLFHVHRALDACGSISGCRPSPASSPRPSCSRWRCCIIRRVLPASRRPSSGFELSRSMMFLIGGILAGAVGVQLRHQFEASIAAATARDRVTNLFGQHVSPAGGRAAAGRRRRWSRAISATSP